MEDANNGYAVSGFPVVNKMAFVDEAHHAGLQFYVTTTSGVRVDGQKTKHVIHSLQVRFSLFSPPILDRIISDFINIPLGLSK